MRRVWADFVRRVPLDNSEIPSSVLNIEKRSRTNLFPWSGQFSPQLVEALLDRYASPGATVLDPFAGSGTVLYEAGRKGLRVAGAEISPAAFGMASTYRLINAPPRARAHSIAGAEEAVLCLCARARRLVSQRRSAARRRASLRAGLLRAAASSRGGVRDLLEALIIRLDFDRAAPLEERVADTWARLKSVVSAFPFSPQEVRLLNVDARRIPRAVAPVDLVLTSPPYINVFNYHQQYRASAEALGWDLLRVARSEIGANRKHRANRFLTVAQYCLDMTQVLGHLGGLCRASSRVVLVVGRASRVRGTPFYNGVIVHALAERCAGLETVLRQERAFTNRFGQVIFEDILHFQPAQRPPPGTEIQGARDVARDALKSAVPACPPEALADLHAAVERVDDTEPSPLFDARRSQAAAWYRGPSRSPATARRATSRGEESSP